MDRKIETYTTLWNLVDIDSKNHKIKDLAILFLEAMNDWSTTDKTLIAEFMKELKEVFGTPLTIEKINNKQFDLTNEENTWQNSIVEMISMAAQFYNEDNFDKILQNILAYYEEDFNKTDFIAQLTYKSTENGGRTTPAHSGYRPTIKFPFDKMQTSGSQTFIDAEKAFPGETVYAKIRIIAFEYFAGRLAEGMCFDFREGDKIIGTGEIKRIVNSKLKIVHR